jgi:bifunctional UDP-N-acetylglucosamine pyrophosphorylase/glucosamine-1-phosphate N-acetyltransferase
MALQTAIVLAAGEGTRMKSSLPKVLHEVAGRSLLGHVLHAVNQLQPNDLRVVVGAGSEEVIAHLAQIAPKATTIFQETRGGTGHAAQLALAGKTSKGTILILAGDTPLLTADLSSLWICIHRENLQHLF